LVPTDYNVGAAYTQGAYTAALVSEKKFDVLKATLLANPRKGWENWNQVGVQVKCNLTAPKSAVETTVGASYASTRNTTWKGALRLNTLSGAFGVKHKLKDPNIQVSATAVFDTPRPYPSPLPITRFGVGISMGEQ